MGINETEEYLKMTDGFSLFCRHWKPIIATGKKIVCIHGMGSHSGAFKLLGPSLASRGFDVYGLDLRGFGKSKEEGLPRGDTKNFSRHLQDIAEVVDFLGKGAKNQRIHMLGHSLGGCYALWFGANYPDSLCGLILAAPAIEVRPRMPKETVVNLPLLLLSNPGMMINTETKLENREGKQNEETIAFRTLGTTCFSVRWLCGVGRNLMRDKAFQNAQKVKTPTLILQGEEDKDAFPTGAKRLLESLFAEDKTLKMFSDCDHSLHNSILRLMLSNEIAEKQDQVFSTIKEWLENH